MDKKNFTRDVYATVELKMRPTQNTLSECNLKKYWMDLLKQNRININFVYDSDIHSVKMWKENGIFVFDCNQNKKES